MKMQPGQLMLEVVSDKTVLDVVNDLASQRDRDDPFYVVDLSDIVYKHKLWKIKMPRVQPFYAVKCNDNPVILELLAALGTGFDCASKAEIESILSLGVDPSRIIYANPCKTKSYIKHAAATGVDLMTFDNEMELLKLRALYPNARLVLRIRVDDASAQCKLGIKFGCQVTDAPHLLRTAKDLGLNVVGVSFHVGSGCRDFSTYSKAILSSRYIFDLAASMGFDMTLLDLGGGFPGHLNSKGAFEEVANIINEALEVHFPTANYPGVTIIAEPGRYYVASSFTLCANIIAKRVIAAEDGESDHMMYYINDGVYGSFNCLIFDHAEVTPIPLNCTESRPNLRTSIWGPTCDSMDRIVESCVFPQMEVGEWLLFENMGAYTVAAASTFNGFPKPMLKFILHLHTLVYLRQLPTWPQLVQSFEVGDWSAAGPTEESLSAHLVNVLPVTEPLSV